MADHFKHMDVYGLVAAGSKRGEPIMGAILRDYTALTRARYGKSTARRNFSRHFTGNSKEVRHKIRTHLESIGFVTFIGAQDRAAIKDGDGDYIDMYIEYMTDGHTVNLSIYGDYYDSDKLMHWFNETFPASGTTVIIAEGVDKYGKLVKRTNYLTFDEIQLGVNEFYPWLSVSLEEYFKAYLESDETVLVLFGPPGTGKSTFLRSLLASKITASWLAYNREVVESPLLLSNYYSSAATLLAYEDIDNYLKSREDGNNLMSTILNASEGVIKQKDKKIVFSTNLSSIDRIDPALLRVGRCFDILQFRNLSVDEAEAARARVNLPKMDFSSKSNWSLAETLAEHVEAQQTVNRFARKAGFI